MGWAIPPPAPDGDTAPSDPEPGLPTLTPSAKAPATCGMTATNPYNGGMTNRDTNPTATAQQFFALAKELIDLSSPTQRLIVATAIAVMCEEANAQEKERELAKTYYPSDSNCEHGTYVGNMGADFMCARCELAY